MARLPRLVVARQVHLMHQQALPGLAPLAQAAECEVFLAALRRAATERGVVVHGYVLLPERFMLVATPTDTGAPGRMMQALSRWFGAGHNRRHGRSGPLWQGRFVAAPLAAERVVDTLLYVEQAPLRAGLVPDALEHAWSSARLHATGGRDPLVVPHAALWALGNTPFEREAHWGRLLATPLAAARLQEIERTLLRGWPLATPATLQAWSDAGGRRTRPLPRGRPRKVAV